MNKKPKFSILMPVLMQFPYQSNMTIVAINNIKAFSYNFELIVLHSMAKYRGDFIRAVLRKQDKYIPFKNNPSQSEALNIGIKKSKGEYIILIGNDNFVHQDWLKEIDVRLEDKDSSWKILGCCVDRMSPKEWDKFRNARKVQNYIQGSNFSYINFQGVTIKRSIIDEVGLFDENLPFYLWERDYNFRLTAKGYSCGIVLDSLMTTPQNMTRMNETLPEGIENWWTKENYEKETIYLDNKWHKQL